MSLISLQLINEKNHIRVHYLTKNISKNFFFNLRDIKYNV